MRGCIKLLAVFASNALCHPAARALNQPPHSKARYGKKKVKQYIAVRRA